MTRKLYLYTFSASLGGLLFGFDIAVINGAIPFFTDYFKLTEVLKGWAVSSALIGSIAGAISIGRPGDYWGRLKMLRLMALFFFVSAFGTGLANHFASFVIFRFIGGLAIGGASVLSPMYISEIAPPKHRGRFTISFQIAIVIGILAAFFSDYLLLETGENNWRWMFIAGAIPAAVFLILLLFVAESPRWLVKVGRTDEARQIISAVIPDLDAEKTIREISLSINNEILDKSVYLFKKPYLKLVIIGFLIGMINQFTGVNIVMYYATDIFRSVGFSTTSAIGQTVIIGVILLIFTIVGMILIDRVGRKGLLLTGSLGMSVFLGLFAYSFFSGNIKGYILLFLLIGFVAFFAASQGSVIWVLLSEMFPNNIRARGTSIGTFSHWFFDGLTAFLFPVVAGAFKNGTGTGYVFCFYAIVTFLSFFFFRKYLVETKGSSLEELEKKMVDQVHGNK
jgi:sugar porter (SP) family MFS transporter